MRKYRTFPLVCQKCDGCSALVVLEASSVFLVSTVGACSASEPVTRISLLARPDSLRYLPLADATVFTFIAPSLSCFACSILLHEPFTRMERIGTVVSFFGVILIAQPHALFHTRASAPATGAPVADIEARDVIAVTPAQRFGAICMALVGVVGSAMAFTAMRSLGKRAHPLFSVNYYSVVCLVASGVVLASVPSISFSLPAGLKEWVYLIVLSCSGFAMQLLLSAGLQMEKSSRATNMVYTQMFFASVSDKLIFGLNPTILGLLGSSLILTSAIYVAVQKEAIKQRQAEEKARRAANPEVAGDLEMQAAAAATAVDVHRFTLATVSEDDDGEGEVAEETDPFMTSIADTKGSTLRD